MWLQSLQFLRILMLTKRDRLGILEIAILFSIHNSNLIRSDTMIPRAFSR